MGGGKIGGAIMVDGMGGGMPIGLMSDDGANGGYATAFFSVLPDSFDELGAGDEAVCDKT